MLYNMGSSLFCKKNDTLYVSDLFDYISRSDIFGDVLSGHLKLVGFEKMTEEEKQKDLMTFITNKDLGVFEIKNPNEYLAFHNQRESINQLKLIMRRMEEELTRIETIDGVLRKIYGEIHLIKMEISKPKEITLKEIHEEIFPEYNISSLRNILSRNRAKNNGYWMSNLNIGGFSLTFRRKVGQKQWRAFRVDYLPQKKDYNLKENIARHTKRYVKK